MASKRLYILTALVLTACSHDSSTSGKRTLSPATLIPDASQKQFQSLKVLMPGDPLGESLSQRPECLDKNGAGHKIIDSRLLPGTHFLKVTTVSRSKDSIQPDEQATSSYQEESTITNQSGTSFVMQDTLRLAGSEYDQNIQCNLQGAGFFLSCPRNAGFTKNIGSGIRETCHLRPPLGQDNSEVVRETGPWFIEGSNMTVDAVRETVTRRGSVICRVFDGNNKPSEIILGNGKRVERHVYSFGVPSISKDSCYAGEIYSLYELYDSNNHVIDDREATLQKYDAGGVAAK